LDSAPPLIRYGHSTKEAVLDRLGLHPQKPFVTLCIRDNSYSKLYFNNVDFEQLSYRNSHIDNFDSVIKVLNEFGYQVVRMGRNTETLIRDSNICVIDYSQSSLRSDRNDYILFANSAFTISTASGIDEIAFSLKKVVLYMNCLPVHIPNESKLLRPILPKVLYSQHGEIIPFKKILSHGLYDLRKTSDYADASIEYRPNSEFTLRAYMYEFLNGKNSLGDVSIPGWAPISKFWPNLNS
jgi:putative glycosyltransferase (TIGR04372 family)